jgi:hypothetical protein
MTIGSIGVYTLHSLPITPKRPVETHAKWPTVNVLFASSALIDVTTSLDNRNSDCNEGCHMVINPVVESNEVADGVIVKDCEGDKCGLAALL